MKNSCFYCLICFFIRSCSTKKDKIDEGSVTTILPDEMTEVRAMRLELTDFYHELIANGTVSARNKADLQDVLIGQGYNFFSKKLQKNYNFLV